MGGEPATHDGDRLSPLDHAAAAGTAATGRNSLVQVTWTYDDPIDLAALHRFRRDLGRGLLGRRIERVAFPCARHRWVRDTTSPPLQVDAPRSRTEISRWVDHRASQPIDPWQGPGWHLALLPLLDGGTVITLVASHALVDGVGMSIAIADAARGHARDLGCPEPRSRGAIRGFLCDARVALGSVPAGVRALATAVREMRARLDTTQPSPDAGPASPLAPTRHERRDTWTVVHVDVADMAARARARGGTSTTLLCGVAAHLAETLGWVSPTTGAATIALSVNRRTSPRDPRANALTEVDVDIVPADAAADLAGVRDDIRTALVAADTNPHPFDAVLPLVPFVPRKLLGALIEAPPDRMRPVTTCAGLGVLDPAVFRPAGTPATDSWFRLTWNTLGANPPLPRRDYLYVGWTGTDTEMAVFASTNLPVPDSTSWDEVVRAAMEVCSLTPSRAPV